MRRRHRSAVPAAALATMALALSAPAAAGATPAGCAAKGAALRYVVLFVPGTPEPAAAEEIAASCGSTDAYYPEIGVAVATATDPAFAATLGTDRAYSAESEGTGADPADDEAAVRALTSRLPGLLGGNADVATTDRAGEQWDMSLIAAPQARQVNPGSADVAVGVLDSGVDAAHPDLAAALDPERSAGCLTGPPDTDPAAWAPTGSDHGTHVAGTIAAADDGSGITGVAPGVRIAAVKVVDDEGFIYPEYAVCGFMWAAQQGLRVANASFFVDPWMFTCSDQPGQSVAHEAVRRAVAHATGSGVLTVAAAGNESADLANPVRDLRSPDNAEPVPRRVDDDCDVLPAELPGVTAVSAVGADGRKSEYSSFGLGEVDVAAPGGDATQLPAGTSSGCVLSTVPDGYGYACGTSMATPHAAGVAALLASADPGAGAQELADRLASGARPLPCDDRCGPDGAREFYGDGLVDALAAVTP